MLIPDKLEEIVRDLRANDALCQEMLNKSYALSEEYFRILEALNSADRICLQQYHDLCEDLEDRTLQLVAAYFAVNGATVYANTEV